MSRPTDDRAIVDSRPKGARLRFGPARSSATSPPPPTRASDEHGRLGISGATNRLQIGDKIRLVPGHCDPTVRHVAIRDNRVEQLWPITARGAVY